MNERIQKLAEQAKTESSQWLGSKPATTITYDELEKFAELIVRECLKEIKDMIVDESELLYPNNKQTTEFVNDRLMDAYDNITELFGVEE